MPLLLTVAWMVFSAGQGSSPATQSTDPSSAIAATDSDQPPSDAAKKRFRKIGRRIQCLRSRSRRCIVVPSYRGDPSIGHQFGLRGRYVVRAPDGSVNRVQLDVATRLSTKLIQDHELTLRVRDLWNKNEILQARVAYLDDPVYPYFGVARLDRLEPWQLEREHNSLLFRTVAFGADLQPELWHHEQTADNPPATLRWAAGARWAFDYVDAPEGARVLDERPQDLGWRRRGSVLAGLSWDRRDNEWASTQGGLHDATVEVARPWAGSTTSWTRLNSSWRFYRTLLTPKVVLAQRLLVDLVWGDPPLYTLGEFGGLMPIDGVGGRNSARGFNRQRLIGPRKGASSTELRYDAIELHLGRKVVGIGVKAFVDVGKVFVESEMLRKNLRHTFGGGVFLVWDRFFVLRLDVGMSNEAVQWYVASGHLF